MNAIKVEYLRSWTEISNPILRYMLFGLSSGLLLSLPIYGQLPPDVQFVNLKEKEVKLAANAPIHEYTWSCCQGSFGGVMHLQEKGSRLIGIMKDNTNGTDGIIWGSTSYYTMNFTRYFVLNGEHWQQVYHLTVSQDGRKLDGVFWSSNTPSNRYKFTATYSKTYS